MKKQRILKIVLEHHCDESPDTSYLGEYRQNPPCGGYYVNREDNTLRDSKNDSIVAGNLNMRYGRGEYQYIGGMQHCGIRDWDHVSNKGINAGYLHCRYKFNGRDGRNTGNLFAYFGVKGWETAQTRNEKIRVLNIVYSCCDAQRLEDLNNGQWSMIGIMAKAQVVLTGTTIQVIRSGGLWGVESDAGDKYHSEVEQEQLDELTTELEALGFSNRAIKTAIREVEKVKAYPQGYSRRT